MGQAATNCDQSQQQHNHQHCGDSFQYPLCFSHMHPPTIIPCIGSSGHRLSFISGARSVFAAAQGQSAAACQIYDCCKGDHSGHMFSSSVTVTVFRFFRWGRVLFFSAFLLCQALFLLKLFLCLLFAINAFLLFDLIQHNGKLRRGVRRSWELQFCCLQRIAPCTEPLCDQRLTDDLFLVRGITQLTGTACNVSNQLLVCILPMLLGESVMLC